MLNKVILIGNVGSDPDIRTMPNGGRVANFSLATSEYWTDKNSQRQSRTEWHKIVIYNENLVRLVEKTVHKGSKLYIEGMIKSRKYTSQQDGIERNIVEIVLQGYDHTIKLLDPRPRDAEMHNSNGGQNDEYGNSEVESDRGSKKNNNDEGFESQQEDVDDDIPF